MLVLRTGTHHGEAASFHIRDRRSKGHDVGGMAVCVEDADGPGEVTIWCRVRHSVVSSGVSVLKTVGNDWSPGRGPYPA